MSLTRLETAMRYGPEYEKIQMSLNQNGSKDFVRSSDKIPNGSGNY